MSDIPFNPNRIQILASCDFKPLGDTGGTGTPTDNELLFDLRATLRLLARSTVSSIINSIEDNQSTIAFNSSVLEDTSNPYNSQITKLTNILGEELDGSATIDPQSLNSMTSGVYDVYNKKTFAIDILDFGKENSDDVADILPGFFTDEQNVVSTLTPSESYVDRRLSIGGSTYYDWLQQFMYATLEFPSDTTPDFSSTKLYAQLLSDIGFAANRFFPNLCSSDQVNYRGIYDTADIKRYGVFGPPELLGGDDLISALSYVEGWGGGSPVTLGSYGSGILDDILFITVHPAAYTLSWAEGYDYAVNAYTGIVSSGDSGLNGIFVSGIGTSDDGRYRPLMQLSRIMAGSSGLKYVETQLIADPDHEFSLLDFPEFDTGNKNKNYTRLTEMTAGGIFSPFDTDNFRPAQIHSDLHMDPLNYLSPQNFITVNVHDDEFEGTGGQIRCSLFEPSTIIDEITEDSPILGTRKYLVGAVFEEGELSLAREKDKLFEDREYKSRYVNTQLKFSNSVEAYRKYIKRVCHVDNNIDATSCCGPTGQFKKLLNISVMGALFERLTSDKGTIASDVAMVAPEFWSYTPLRILAHTCLFSQENVIVQMALAEYCYHLFRATRLGDLSGERMFNFLRGHDTINITDSPNAELTRDLSTLLLTDTIGVESVVGSSIQMADDGVATIPFILVRLLKEFGDVSTSSSSSGVAREEIVVNEYELYRSLCISWFGPSDPLAGDDAIFDPSSPFQLLFDFYLKMVERMYNRGYNSSGDATEAFYNLADVDSYAAMYPDWQVAVTKAGGLDEKSLFIMCFKIFRTLFVSYSEGGDSSFPRMTKKPTDAWVGIIDYTPTNPGFNFEFHVPNNWQRRFDNREETINATGPVSGFTVYSTARETYEKQEQKMVTALSHLGTIRKATLEGILKLSELSESGNVLLDTINPIGELPLDRTASFMKYGFDESHLATLQASRMNLLPQVSPYVSTDVSFLPARDKLEAPPGFPDNGRLNVLRAFLKSEVGNPLLATSPDNMFDPSNVRILCLGIPADGIVELKTPALSVNSDSINTDPGGPLVMGGFFSGTLWDQTSIADQSLLKITMYKKDALLPTVEFEPIVFYWDPRLRVMPEGFDDVSALEPLEQQLDKIKLGRIRFTGTHFENATVESIQLDDGTLTFTSGGDDLNSLDTAAAQQLVYLTAMSELMKMYTSLISGLDLGEEGFHTSSPPLDLRVDDLVTILSTPNSIYDFIGSIPDETLLPSTPEFASALLGSAAEGEAYERINGVKVKTQSDVAADLEVTTPGDVESLRLLYNSTFFRPEVLRNEIIMPKMFEGCLFYPLDMDSFKVASFSSDDDDAAAIAGALSNPDINLLYTSEGDFDAATYDLATPTFVIKSGNNESATGIYELNIDVASTSGTNATAADHPGGMMDVMDNLS